MSTSSYPENVQRILADRGLEVACVYRNGPRYWVADVLEHGSHWLLKVVSEDPALQHLSETGQPVYTVDQLKVEILLYNALSQRRAAGPIVAAAGGDHSWVLREHYPGTSMAAGTSPFVFREDFFEPEHYIAVIDHILEYQQLTPDLAYVLGRMPEGAASVLNEKIQGIGLDEAVPWLAGYTDRLRAYAEPLGELHARHVGTLSHGQVFPPHIYVGHGQVNLIDWENVNFNSKQQDLVALWIRGFDKPKWQAAFIEELLIRGFFEQPEGRLMWDLEVLLQSAGNLNYLFRSQLESTAVKKAAAASLVQNIENILGGRGLQPA